MQRGPVKDLAKRVSNKRYWKSLSKFLPLVLITIVVAVFFWKFFILGYIPIPGDFVIGTYYPWLDYKWGYTVGVPVKNPITTDVVSFTYPMRTLAVNMMKAGQWPLWNKNILTGVPLLANFQSAPFTVTNIFYFLFNTKVAWGFQVVTQHILASYFMFLLLTRWGISKKTSYFSGILYAFSGFNLIWSQWNAHTLVAAFIPLILYCVDKFLDEGNPKYGLIASIALALQFFAGYPQLLLYSLIIVGIYYFFIFKWNVSFIKRSLLLAIFFIIGIGITALELMPAKELLSLSQRAVEPLDFSMAFLPWQKVVTFVAPDFFGNHSTNNYWGPTDYTMTTGFVGVVGLSFAASALYWIKRNRLISYALLLMIVSLVLSLPTPVSIYIWKSGFLGLQAASAHRALIIFNISVAFLSAFGMDYFLKSKVKHWNFILVPVILLGLFSTYVCLGIIGVNIFEYPQKWQLSVALRNLALPWVITISVLVFLLLYHINILKQKLFYLLIFFLMIFELFRFGWKFTPFTKSQLVFPDTPVMTYLKNLPKPVRVSSTDVIPINMKMPYMIESVEGYDAIYPINIAKYAAVSNSGDIHSNPQGRYSYFSNPKSPMFDIANAKYILALRKDENNKPNLNGKISEVYSDDNFENVFEDKTTVVLRNKKALERAVFYYDWEYVENNEESLTRFLKSDFDYKEKLIINSSNIKQVSKNGDYSLNWEKYDFQESIVTVDTTQNGYLFLSDLNYPGWKAELDGRKANIETANYTFGAVYITKGKHKVRFIYKPDSFYKGLKISIFSFCVLLLYTYTIKIFHHNLWSKPAKK